MSLKRIARIAAGVALGAGSLFLVIAPGWASASTTACDQAAGAFTGYCGLTTDQTSAHLSFDVYGAKAAAGQPVIGYADSAGDAATDFIWLPVAGAGGKEEAIYAPDGVPSVFCVSEPTNPTGSNVTDGLELRYCNGSTYQQFTLAGTTLTNAAASNVIQSNGAGTAGHRLQLTGATASGGTAQQWKFTQTGG